MKRLTADSLLVIAAALWGLGFYFQKAAMSDVGPFVFIAARTCVASVALAPLALLELRRRAGATAGPPLDLAGLLRLGLLGGVCFFLGAVLQQAGLVTATVTNAGFLTSLYVVITPLIMWLTARRSPSPAVWMAVGLAFAGTWALGGGTFGGFSYGDMLIAICAIFWALHIFVTGRSPRFGAPMTYTCVQFAAVAAIATTAALLFEPISVEALAKASGPILYVGIMSSAVTFTLMAIAMKYTPTSEAAVLVSTETLFAALAGALLLGERLPPIGWFGAALLFSASLLVQVAPREKAIHDAA